MDGRGGAADSYYNGNAVPAQPQMQYPPQAHGNGYQNVQDFQGRQGYQGAPQPSYQQPPPNYGQPLQTGGPPVQRDGKQTFSEAFKLDKPRYNDLWAGILVCCDRV